MLLAGQDWSYDPEKKEMRSKMKGHKCDRIAAERRENTANLMQKMPEMLLAYKKRRITVLYSSLVQRILSFWKVSVNQVSLYFESYMQTILPTGTVNKRFYMTACMACFVRSTSRELPGISGKI
ncbi:hypothetical protein PVK06_030205 [Gossypium arboreum]|uniref:Uncharacterized protein n=1 Tax=Gossypium arboreum TaxID=29729 RepID=A0ABR0NQS5_GOSAR|nr:hypothetical protein PVK06_030205 [Gossypium arboreum]